MWADWTEAFFRVAAASSLRAILVAAAVALILMAFRVRSGGVRHAAWTAVLAAMLLMPILPGVVPGIVIPFNVPGAAGEIAFTQSYGSALQAPEGALADRPDVVPSGGREPVGRSSPAVRNQELAGATATALRPTSGGEFWRPILIGLYAAGMLFFLSRLAVGWLAMRRLVGSGAVLDLAPAGFNVRGIFACESPHVAAPLTAGVLSRHVILPSAWRSWPEEKLHAVLAHEFAHARRRDPLVTLAASLNRAVFWFHPLAWWLERALAAAAEDACDGAAVRAVATPRRYAEVLLDMAQSVRRSRGRVAWQGVGVDGTGLLGQRIDRIMRGDFDREMSMTRKISVATACVIAIVLIMACRQQQPPPSPPLNPNPEISARLQRERESTAFYNAAKSMTAQQAADLEAVLQKDPENPDARKKLGIFYRASGQATIGWNETVAARRRHILWLIEHEPGGAAIVGWGTIYPQYDPAGYAQAKKLWLAHIARKDAPIDILSNAAYFFSNTDKPLAEQLLLRLEAMDPRGPKPRVRDNVYYSGWSERLGELYATAIMGLTEGTWRIGGYKTTPEEARSPFALEARKKLEATKDSGILGGAAEVCYSRGYEQPELRAEALSYLERAVQANPNAPGLRRQLEMWRMRDRTLTLSARLRGVPHEKQAAVVAALADTERIALEPSRTDMEYMQAEYFEYVKKDRAAAAVAWDQTKKYAEDLLTLSGALPGDPNRGTAIFSAHVALAALALHDNDKASALEHLEEAVKAPPSDELKHGFNALWSRVAVGLLKRGERESVARFLDRYAQLNESQRAQLTKSAAAIRAGTMPDFYQYQVTPH